MKLLYCYRQRRLIKSQIHCVHKDSECVCSNHAKHEV